MTWVQHLVTPWGRGAVAMPHFIARYRADSISIFRCETCETKPEEDLDQEAIVETEKEKDCEKV